MKHLEIIHQKIISASQLNLLTSKYHFKDKKIVFTNGCFDILHLGHIDYLSKAADLGHILIVGVNADASVGKLKPGRPIHNQLQRMVLIASLHFVDHVILFEEDTPINLINQIKPDVLVKGADYKIENIVGGPEVTANGGIVVTIPFLEGYGTSLTIEKINTAKK
ncbi:MAG: D-glycero-beta-D-manno-heptose 1-phosphate adenylyltransferase [Bacteroidota bacterium]|jgi:rfaE bifunctional protein nucleotidyltransferase chain/domain